MGKREWPGGRSSGRPLNGSLFDTSGQSITSGLRRLSDLRAAICADKNLLMILGGLDVSTPLLPGANSMLPSETRKKGRSL